MKEKEKETEAYLEEHAEEKVMAMLEIKQKYSKQLTLLKVSAAKPGNELAAQEKIRAMEEKKRSEEQEVTIEMANKKAERLQEIKQQYNEQAKHIKIDVALLRQALSHI